MSSEDTKAELAKYRSRVGASMFFYDRIDEMDREELLGLVGWMMADKEATVKMRDDHIKFMDDIHAMRRL